MHALSSRRSQKRRKIAPIPSCHKNGHACYESWWCCQIFWWKWERSEKVKRNKNSAALFSFFNPEPSLHEVEFASSMCYMRSATTTWHPAPNWPWYTNSHRTRVSIDWAQQGTASNKSTRTPMKTKGSLGESDDPLFKSLWSFYSLTFFSQLNSMYNKKYPYFTWQIYQRSTFCDDKMLKTLDKYSISIIAPSCSWSDEVNLLHLAS